jgi:hypothetical protein
MWKKSTVLGRAFDMKEKEKMFHILHIGHKII